MTTRVKFTKANFNRWLGRTKVLAKPGDSTQCVLAHFLGEKCANGARVQNHSYRLLFKKWSQPKALPNWACDIVRAFDRLFWLVAPDGTLSPDVYRPKLKSALSVSV